MESNDPLVPVAPLELWPDNCVQAARLFFGEEMKRDREAV